MPERLKKLRDSLEFDSEDEEKFGDRVLYFLDVNEAFWDETNNYEYLRTYIKDTLEYDQIEIEYHKKYTPQVFHENTYKSLEFEDKLWVQLLNKLNEQL